jgi:hypothetical protein
MHRSGKMLESPDESNTPANVTECRCTNLRHFRPIAKIEEDNFADEHFDREGRIDRGEDLRASSDLNAPRSRKVIHGVLDGPLEAIFQGSKLKENGAGGWMMPRGRFFH